MPTVSHGEGTNLYDSTGPQYLDACGGAAVSCLRHSDARVKQAIMDQLEKIPFAHTGCFTNDPAERLAAKLAARAQRAGLGALRVRRLGVHRIGIEDGAPVLRRAR